MHRLTTFQTCPTCCGLGKTMNRDWRVFLSGWLSAGGGSPLDQVRQQEAHFLRLGYAQVPDILEPCSCCNGQGQVTGAINADDIEYLPAETASRLGLPLDSTPNKPGTAPVDTPSGTLGD